jgi:uncharacterized membrane protein
MKPSLTREQQTIILHGVLGLAVFLLLLQLWLLTATVNACLGGDESVVWPAALASVVCCSLNVALFRYLGGLDRRQTPSALKDLG